MAHSEWPYDESGSRLRKSSQPVSIQGLKFEREWAIAYASQT